MSGDPGGGASTLRVIAGFKLLEALLLVVAGLGALGMLEPARQQDLVGWLDELSLREGRRLTSEFAARASGALGSMSIQRFVLIAVGCFVYGAVFLVEAVGLWLGKRWAEYLTTLVTASLLPFEVVELVHHQSAGRVLTLVVNLLVLGYLVRRLATRRDGAGDART